MAKVIPLESFNSVSSGSTATLSIQGGITIDEIHLKYNHDATNFNLTHIERVQIMLGGTDLVDLSGAELVMLEKYRGRFVEDGRIVIPFKELTSKTWIGEHVGAVILYPSEQLHIKVKIGTLGASYSPTLSGTIETRPSTILRDGKLVQQQRKILPKIVKYPSNSATGGDVLLNSFDRSPAIRHKRMHFYSPNMTGLKLYRDDVLQFDQDKADNNFMIKRHDLVPQADYFHLDHTRDGYIEQNSFRTDSRKLDYKATLSGAGRIDTIVEMLVAV